MRETVLITGATGFVGQAVVTALIDKAALRKAVRVSSGAADEIAVGDITTFSEWSSALTGVNVVVHLAARVHQMQDTANSIDAHRLMNRDVTRRIAESAAAQGVRRFVYVSSIKVNGEGYPRGTHSPYTEDSIPNPQDPYGISKWEAEQALAKICHESSMDFVIIRPPLVYGAGVKANFLRLLGLAKSGIPLPFATLNNRRSMIYVENLADLIAHSIAQAGAANQTFLASDTVAFSTKVLIQKMAESFGKSAPMFPFPLEILRVGARFAGKYNAVSRLIDSLEVDGGKAHRLLDWVPPYSVQIALHRTVEWFQKSHDVV